MKVFVATKEGQGGRKNDFCWADEAELVRFTFECDDDGPDGSCGCKRAMAGMVSQKSTTTFKVTDVKLTKKQYFEKVKESFDKGGWLKMGISDKQVQGEANELSRMAKLFPVGAVLEKRGPEIQIREVKKKR